MVTYEPDATNRANLPEPGPVVVEIDLSADTVRASGVVSIPIRIEGENATLLGLNVTVGGTDVRFAFREGSIVWDTRELDDGVYTYRIAVAASPDDLSLAGQNDLPILNGEATGIIQIDNSGSGASSP